MEEDFVPNGSRSPIDELIQIYAYRHLTSEIIDMRKKYAAALRLTKTIVKNHAIKKTNIQSPGDKW